MLYNGDVKTDNTKNMHKEYNGLRTQQIGSTAECRKGGRKIGEYKRYTVGEMFFEEFL